MIRTLHRLAPLALLAACKTTAVHDDTPQAAHATDAAVTTEAGATAAIDAGSPVPTVLFPVTEGACAVTTAYAIGTTPVLVSGREAWTLTADGAKVFYRQAGPVYSEFEGRMLGEDNHIAEIGGDDTHAWARLTSETNRGQDDSRVELVRPARKALQTPRGQYGFYGITGVVPQPDGALWIFGDHSMYLDIPGDEKIPNDRSHDHYFAFSPAGAPITTNLPGPDMGHGVRFANGEILASGESSGKAILRRWSPTRKVNDLVSGTSTKDAPALLVGTSRAVLVVEKQHAFWSYTGEDKLVPSALNAQAKTTRSWALTAADELIVASADGTLHIEGRNGTVTEEKLPEPGRLAGETSRVWLIADSGALHVRGDGKWQSVTYPANGPWSADTHPPSRIEWVRTVAGETLVGTVRTDAGFGATKPGPVRVVYSSRPHPNALRCGSPYDKGALGTFPPRADAGCTSTVVVVAPESEKPAKVAYAKIAAALKGDAALGESVTFVAFGKDLHAIGILAPTPEIAKELVKKLGKVAPHAPELVCGAPDEHARFVLETRTGTFADKP